MVMRGTSTIRGVLLVAAVLMAWAGQAHADGGVLVLDDRDGPFLITVFAAPAPLRAGPVDLSVLVRDARTGQPILDADVRLELERESGGAGDEMLRVERAPDEHAEHDMHAGAGDHAGHGPPPTVLRATATRKEATNKLLRAALIELPSTGEWRLTVRVSRNGRAAGSAGTVHATLAAGPPLPAWVSLWRVLLVPPLVVALFLVHQLLAQRRRDARSGNAATRPS